MVLLSKSWLRIAKSFVKMLIHLNQYYHENV